MRQAIGDSQQSETYGWKGGDIMWMDPDEFKPAHAVLVFVLIVYEAVVACMAESRGFLWWCDWAWVYPWIVYGYAVVALVAVLLVVAAAAGIRALLAACEENEHGS